MKDIYTTIDEISELLNSRTCLIEIKEIEKEMESNQEVIDLVMKFESVQREYSSGLNHYDENSKELLEIQKRLYEAKLNLDSHPLVEKYYSLLSEVNEPLRYLEMKLLSLFKINKGDSCK